MIAIPALAFETIDTWRVGHQGRMHSVSSELVIMRLAEWFDHRRRLGRKKNSDAFSSHGPTRANVPLGAPVRAGGTRGVRRSRSAGAMRMEHGRSLTLMLVFHHVSVVVVGSGTGMARCSSRVCLRSLSGGRAGWTKKV